MIKKIVITIVTLLNNKQFCTRNGILLSQGMSVIRDKFINTCFEAGFVHDYLPVLRAKGNQVEPKGMKIGNGKLSAIGASPSSDTSAAREISGPFASVLSYKFLPVTYSYAILRPRRVCSQRVVMTTSI